MVKCVVTGCPNRTSSRAAKTFFRFPSDPIRVKVWLAALRETDQLDPTGQQLICEDHFLKEDLTANGVREDAIPIMSPYLDGSLGTDRPWGGEVLQEEEEEEEEEEEDVCVAVYDDPDPDPDPDPPDLDGGPSISSPAEDPGPDPGPGQEETPETKDLSPVQKRRFRRIRRPRSGESLPLRFLRLLQTLPGVTLSLAHLHEVLQADKRRISDISSVLAGMNLVEKQRNRIRWIGGSGQSSDPVLQSLQNQLENLILMEEELDRLIRDGALQLSETSNERRNAELAYVTLDDVRRLAAFEEQTLMVLRAPDETVLRVPEPSEDLIQIHMRSWNGPITALTCDITAAERSAGFSPLEGSRIKTSSLRRGDDSLRTSPHAMRPSGYDVTSCGDAMTP